MISSLDEYLSSSEKEMIHTRRILHQIPEPGWCEYQTTAFIVRFLRGLSFELFLGKEAVQSEERMGLPTAEQDAHFFQLAEKAGVEKPLLEQMKGGHTGAVAVLDTGRPGPDTALRFDIDALPITEAKEQHLPSDKNFISRHDGFMHACAHDGHAVIGMYLAKYIALHQEHFTGTFTFLFQPAEEGSRGAKAMVDRGWLDGKDYFLSGHLGIHELEAGTIVSGAHQFLATSKIDVSYTGVSAHAGVNPAAGKNALLAAASAAVQLQSIAPHRDGLTRLNVGTLQAGEGRNIIPSTAAMALETRGEANELNDYVEQEAVRILQAAAAMYDVKIKIDIVGKGVTASSSKTIAESVTQLQGERIKKVLDPLPLGGSEDATHMMNRVNEAGGKAAYLIYGSRLPFGHHHPQFDFEEAALAAAVETLGLLLHDYHREELS